MNDSTADTALMFFFFIKTIFFKSPGNVARLNFNVEHLI